MTSPNTDSWSPISNINAPSPRKNHIAVWTDSEMIIWGGQDGLGAYLGDDARYNLATDSWAPVSNSILGPRAYLPVIWTGSEMIVWGGQVYIDGQGWIRLNDGARYNPATDTWTSMSMIEVPTTRSNHSAIWTDSEMIIWGGQYSAYNNRSDGARYNPTTDSWTSLSAMNAPSKRHRHRAVWTGDEMVFWGGYDDFDHGQGAWPTLGDGVRYNLATDSWFLLSDLNVPVSRTSHTAIWDGSDMIVWGGGNNIQFFNDGSSYNPITNIWNPLSSINAPHGRLHHTAIWADDRMIVWGGLAKSSNFLNDGAQLRQTNVTTQTIATHSGFRGHIDGVFALKPHAVTFSPSTSFLPGELVQTTITTDVLGMDNGYVWEFRTAVFGGTGTFTDSGHYLSDAGTNAVALGDLDGDKDIDAFVANYGVGFGEPNKVWLNNGTGGFTDSGKNLGNSASWGVALGDLDHDGDLDAFVANKNDNSGAANIVWINNGVGVFTDSGQSLGNSDSRSVALGDLDGDGDLDAFIANRSLQANKVWLNNGYGFFSDSGQNLGTLSSTSIALGDLDSDGDLDAFVANDGSNKIWINDGNANFSSNAQSLGAFASHAVALGDLDSDGDLDAFVANNTQVNKIWLNNGEGFFNDGGQVGDSLWSYAVTLGDIDHDGDLDAFVGNSANQPNTVWENNGTGVFVNTGQNLANSKTRAVPLADLDNDGDLDAFVGNTGEANEVWLNQEIMNCNHVSEISLVECEALVSLYNNTNGTDWNTSDWLTTNTPCSWGGINCNAGHVTVLSLADNNMRGTIPPEIGNLIHLTHLYFGLNFLTGPVPTEIGNLTNLVVLSLEHNQLSILPTEIGNLTNLTYLYLGNNLFGILPIEIGNLTNLTHLYLNNVQLDTVPIEIENLTHLETFYLDRNYLSTLPAEMNSLTNLTHLSLGNNQLGNLSFELCDLNNFDILDVGFNKLTPDFDTDVCIANFDPDWKQTQTIPPENVQVSIAAEDDILLEWTPISYTADFGYYEISYATSISGPFTVHGTTTDKTVADYTINDLPYGFTYTFQIRTFTAAHGEQQNDLWSTAVTTPPFFHSATSVALHKMADAVTAVPGQTLNYTLVYSNAGSQIMTGVIITDLLPTGLMPITYTYSGPMITVTNGVTFAWQVANLAPGEGGIITITAMVDPDLTSIIPINGYKITNTAVIATQDVDSQLNNNVNTSVIEVIQLPPLKYHAIATGFENAYDVVTADIDGDGNLDVVGAAHNSSSNLVWWRNVPTADGVDWIPHPITTELNGLVAVDVADINDDGHIDILVANFASHTIRWFENDGTGTNWQSHTITTNFSYPYDVAAADVDADGDVDIVGAGYDGVAWWANDGVSVGGTAISPQANEMEVKTLFVADINGDGKQDFLGATQSGIYWWLNDNGDGLTWSKHLVHNVFGVTDLHVAPINYNDTHADIVASVSGGESPGIYWWRNQDGDGLTWQAQAPLIRRSGIRSIDVVNLNVDHQNDLYLDVVAAVDNQVRWWQNKNGSGTDWVTRIAPGEVNGINSVHVADVDNNGRLDIIGAGNSEGIIACWGNKVIGDSAIITNKMLIGTPTAFAYGQIANLDGDGDSDVIGVSQDGLLWWRNELATTGWITQTITTNYSDLQVIATADLNGDSHTDILGASTTLAVNLLDGRSSDSLTWWRNVTGDGSQWVTTTIASGVDHINALATADIDEDGNVDIVTLSDSPTNLLLWWANSSDASSWVSHTIATSFTGGQDLRVVDLDQDGDFDIVAASQNGSIVWWANNGDATSWQEQVIGDNLVTVAAIDVQDMDSNGRLDIIAALPQANTIRWWSSPDGVNWTAHDITDDFIAASGVHVTDLDLDGDFDVLGTAHDNHQLAWWENEGNNLWHYHLVDDQLSDAAWLSSANLDGDGDVDVVAAAYNDGLFWWPNEGGQFGLHTTATAAPNQISGAIDDLLQIDVTHYGREGDGDLALTSLALLWESSSSISLTTQEINQLLDTVVIYADDGSGFFERHRDLLVTTVTTVTLNDGIQIVPFVLTDPNVQVPVDEPRRYFVVAQLTSDAHAHTPNHFQVTHLTAPDNNIVSQAEDSDFGYALTMAYAPDVASGLVTAVEAVPIQLTAESGYDSIQLKWNPTNDPDVVNYRIWRAVSETAVFTPVITLESTVYFDVDGTLEPHTHYCYYIEALDADAQVRLTSNTNCAVFGLVDLWIPSVQGKPGQTAIIPINVHNAQGLEIIASDIWLDYDGRILNIYDVTHTGLTQHYDWGYNVVNTGTYSRVNISLLNISPTPLYDDGSLFWLHVEVTDTLDITTPLDLREYIQGVGGSTIYVIDDLVTPIPLVVQDNIFRVTHTYTLGDVNGNQTTCESIDRLLILMAVARRITPTPLQIAAGDINGNGYLDAGDASMIFYCTLHGTFPTPQPVNNLLSLPRREQNEPIITFRLSDLVGLPGTLVSSTIVVSDNVAWASGEIIIAYDDEIIAGVADVRLSGLATEVDMVFEDNGAGLLQIALASTTAVTYTGPLLTIDWQLADDPPVSTSSLNLADVQLYDAFGRNVATSELQYSVARESGVVCVAETTVAPQITISRQGDEIRITWDDHPVNVGGYQLWSSNSAYNNYDMLDADVTSPATLSLNPASIFYTVIGVNACGLASSITAPVGQFAFPLISP